MSETEKTNITLPFMSETEIAALSVKALSNRPNEHSGQYGRKGLTPEELKAAFSALPEAIAARMNGLLPKLLSRFSELETACGESNEALKVAIMKSVAELDEALKSELSDAISGKLDRKNGSTTYRTAYAEGTDGKVEMIPVRSAVVKGAIVSYGDDHRFMVASPMQGGHPINKTYFDNKSNNSLYSEITDMERRLTNLEGASRGTLYETVTLHGVTDRFQVKNALPYGIISTVDENVQCHMGLPYDLKNATAGLETGTPVSVISDNSFKIPKGTPHLAFIPVNISEGTIFTLSCRGANAAGDKVAKFGLFSKKSSSGIIGSTMILGSTAVASADVSYIGIYHTRASGGSNLLDDLIVEDIVLEVQDTYLIGVGLYDTAETYISDDGVIGLKPNAVLHFDSIQEIELTYKNKRTVN